MSEEKLKTGLLGLNERGQRLLETLREVEHFRIEAVADRDPVVAEKVAAEYGCEAYDDYRQLVMQNQLDCLLVAAGMHSCDEYVRAAMKKKFNVLKLSPGGRNFEEAAEFVRLSEAEGVKFAIAAPLRYHGSFLAMRRFLSEHGVEQVFLVRVFFNAGDEPKPAWHTDPKLAGGGVLLHNAYEMVDQVVWNFSIPQTVYALNTNQAQDKQQRLYLTEDTGVVTMKFSDRLSGSLIACRRASIGPLEWHVSVYGQDRILTVSSEGFVVSDGGGATIEEFAWEGGDGGGMREVLENFGECVAGVEGKSLSSSGRESLRTMAVIESAYLSGRTGMPEEPGRILQMAQLEG
jgi:predicted dehydrogenase